MRAMCSEISAQNWGTSDIRVLSACCFSRGSCSVSKERTPAADDCGRGTIEMKSKGVLVQRTTRAFELAWLACRDASPSLYSREK